MSKMFKTLREDHIEFISKQPVFFTGTAAGEGTVNVSPKGMDALRVLNNNELLWLNLTGSGNETAAHLLQNTRITLMWCSFDEKPLILRVYGQGESYENDSEYFKQNISLFPSYPGARQLVKVKIHKVQTSCGYAVPIMDFKEDRTVLNQWAKKQGEGRLMQYRDEKNSISIDGFKIKK